MLCGDCCRREIFHLPWMTSTREPWKALAGGRPDRAVACTGGDMDAGKQSIGRPVPPPPAPPPHHVAASSASWRASTQPGLDQSATDFVSKVRAGAVTFSCVWSLDCRKSEGLHANKPSSAPPAGWMCCNMIDGFRPETMQARALRIHELGSGRETTKTTREAVFDGQLTPNTLIRCVLETPFTAFDHLPCLPLVISPPKETRPRGRRSHRIVLGWRSRGSPCPLKQSAVSGGDPGHTAWSRVGRESGTLPTQFHDASRAYR
jgi:hypothetical protein